MAALAPHAEKKYLEGNLSESAENRRREIDYWIYEVETLDAAKAILLRDSPQKEGDLERIEISGVSPVAFNVYQGTVIYGPFVGGLGDPTAVDFPGREASFQFETGGGRRTVRRNLATMATHVKIGDPPLDPDVCRLINATPENGVEGVEIESSVFNFVITKSWSVGELPSDYAETIKRLTNKKNSLPVTVIAGGIVMKFKIGELLFKGGSGAIDLGDGRWRFSYPFASIPNEKVNLPGFAPFEVQGWDYLEVRTVGKLVGPDGKKIPVREPYAAIVHAVYFADDLNELML